MKLCYKYIFEDIKGTGQNSDIPQFSKTTTIVWNWNVCGATLIMFDVYIFHIWIIYLTIVASGPKIKTLADSRFLRFDDRVRRVWTITIQTQTREFCKWYIDYIYLKAMDFCKRLLLLQTKKKQHGEEEWLCLDIMLQKVGSLTFIFLFQIVFATFRRIFCHFLIISCCFEAWKYAPPSNHFF